jgi:Flp pilus assembly pilin Flp
VFWTECLARFVRDEQAQDLVEYGLLLGTVAAVGVALFPQIVTAMGTAFSQWNSQINDQWIPQIRFSEITE